MQDLMLWARPGGGFKPCRVQGGQVGGVAVQGAGCWVAKWGGVAVQGAGWPGGGCSPAGCRVALVIKGIGHHEASK